MIAQLAFFLFRTETSTVTVKRFSDDKSDIPMGLSSFHARMWMTSRGEADSDLDRLFIAWANGFGGLL